jgi:hypothetical protein
MFDFDNYWRIFLLLMAGGIIYSIFFSVSENTNQSKLEEEYDKHVTACYKAGGKPSLATKSINNFICLSRKRGHILYYRKVYNK